MTDPAGPAPLRLYWWNKAPNFGDALSRDVLSQVSGRPVVWAPEQTAEVFSIGSIMWHVRKGVAHRAPGHAPPLVWGTGCMEPIGTGWCAGARIAALRGPLTAGVLEQAPPLALGDPGLLARDVTGEVRREDIIGIVPHHSQIAALMQDAQTRDTQTGNAQMGALRAGLPDHIRIIDVRSNDACAVIRQIAGCRHIFSQSLHGLIVADAYGIPNTLLAPEGIHRNAWFKFYDYFASIGRVPEPGLSYAGLADVLKAGVPDRGPLPWAGRISDLRAGLIAAFPVDLRG